MDDHVVFFFGSGVSMPTFSTVSDSDFEGSVEEITHKVLEAPLVFTEHKRYAFPDSVETNPNIGQPHETSDERIERVRSFLEVVRGQAEAFLHRFNRDVTYEDLYALCGEVVSYEEERKLATEPVNPAIRPFSEVLRNEANDFLLRDDDNPVFRTANEATFLISGVVRELLSDSPGSHPRVGPPRRCHLRF